MNDQNPPRSQHSQPPVGRDGDTEARILEAAIRVLSRHGTAGARMQEIAAEAGVNPALLHYYFRSKAQLSQAVFQATAGRLVPAVLELLGSSGTLEEKIEQVVHLYIDTVRATPFLPGYIVSELHHHPERLTDLRSAVTEQPMRMARALLENLGAQLRERAGAGTMRSIAPEQFVVNLFGLLAMPFVARPLLVAAFGFDEAAYGRFLDERRIELPTFILNALRP